ncbi:ABC transporter permease [Ruficoccus amylovorans]|uniref:Transport permease protein n=1 Tax=Ruficoccus amylovorans TaxID=1804625 RepID=A0A842HDD0_9BACT|nr:ABC transporter permease [Ruficoccus amylovorans]MBC2594535.1 ABC transporter permease [Ruficoccus amylovorans]
MSELSTDKTLPVITVIQPAQGWLRIDWREIWNYRDLLLLLVRRDFVSRYKQSLLGPLWFVLQPLVMTVVFTVIFGRIAQIPSDGVPHTLFYLCGLLGWNYFAQILNGTSTTFTSNAHIFQKIYFPRLVVPFSVAASSIFTFIIQLGLFLLVYAGFKFFSDAGANFGMTWRVVFVPLLLVHSGILALGVGLWMSALTAKYRDLSHLNQFIIQIWLYLTIIIPVSSVPAKYLWFVLLNPMTPIIEAYKIAFLGKGTVEPLFYLCSIVISLGVFFTGTLAFQRTGRTFADTV